MISMIFAHFCIWQEQFRNKDGTINSKIDWKLNEILSFAFCHTKDRNIVLLLKEVFVVNTF